MGSVRAYRIVEGGLVTLFFIQASRMVFGTLTTMTSAALAASQMDLVVVNSNLLLVASLVLVWLFPRSRSRLPETLSISAILVSGARIVMSLGMRSVQLYAGIAIFAFAGIYMVSLLRANRRSWLAAIIVAMAVDQVGRAYDTYDLSLRLGLDIAVGDAKYHVPWFVVQILLSFILAVVSRLARRLASQEPYEPSQLTILGGLALGGFFALEALVLSMPNVVARWTNVSYAGLVPWLLFATVLPLLASGRHLMGHLLGAFDTRLRGWVWLFVLLLMVLVGNRLSGVGASGALIIAQFMSILSLWWMVSSPSPLEVEQSGPAFCLGIFAFFLLLYAYSFTFGEAAVFGWLRGRSVIVVLLAVGLVGLPQIMWREDEPWLQRSIGPIGVPLAFIVPVVMLGLVLSGLGARPIAPPIGDTLRIATYNINGGYDARGIFQLELTAQAIEASRADIVALQEVDAGRPVSYGIDEVQFLSTRLNMYHIYYPVTEMVYGVAILSRWPIISEGGGVFPGADTNGGVVYGLVYDSLMGRSVQLVNVQLGQGADDQRVQQLAMLLELLGDTEFIILAADLKAPPQDIAYERLLRSDLIDPDMFLGIERGFTTPAYNPTVRHDYILFRGFNPIDSRQVGEPFASDHRLVVIEVGWP